LRRRIHLANHGGEAGPSEVGHGGVYPLDFFVHVVRELVRFDFDDSSGARLLVGPSSFAEN